MTQHSSLGTRQSIWCARTDQTGRLLRSYPQDSTLAIFFLPNTQENTCMHIAFVQSHAVAERALHLLLIHGCFFRGKSKVLLRGCTSTDSVLLEL